MKEIICIGTSYTEGGGLYDPLVKEYYKKQNIVYDKQSEVSWPSHLNKLSNIKVRNLGKCGSGIDYLIRNVENIIENEDISDKLLILEYSGWGRTELWDSTRNQYIVTNWGPTDGKDPKNGGYSVMMTTDYTYGMQLEPIEFKLWEKFLETHFNEKDFLINRDKQFVNLLYKLLYKKINFMVIYLENPFWVGIYDEPVIIDNSIFMTTNNSKVNYGQQHGLSEFVATKGERIIDIIKDSNDYHPNIKGHESIAVEIYNKIKNKLQ
jgi:hypothetical protein